MMKYIEQRRKEIWREQGNNPDSYSHSVGQAMSEYAKEYLTSLQSKGKTKEEVKELLNPYSLIVKEKLEGDYISQESCVSLMLQFAIDAFEAESHANQDGWVSVEDRLPDLIKGQDYSETVFAMCEGRMLVMRSVLLNEDGNPYRVWMNCYGDIDGDGEYDDAYNVTYWHPRPKPQP